MELIIIINLFSKYYEHRNILHYKSKGHQNRVRLNKMKEACDVETGFIECIINSRRWLITTKVKKRKNMLETRQILSNFKAYLMNSFIFCLDPIIPLRVSLSDTPVSIYDATTHCNVLKLEEIQRNGATFLVRLKIFT
jgi:hypothetical protein